MQRRRSFWARIDLAKAFNYWARNAKQIEFRLPTWFFTQIPSLNTVDILGH